MGNLVRLQAVGLSKGKPAGEITPGATLRWNFGATSQVKAIIKETTKSIWFLTETDNGSTFERRFLKTRVIAIA